MNDAGLACIADTHVLFEISQVTSGNLKTTLLDQLISGVIGVPACAWKEFKETFPDEAGALESYVPKKITMGKKAYTAKAGLIAEKRKQGFRRGPYDEGNDILVAAIACVEKSVVLTSKNQMTDYDGMDCSVIDLETWLSSFA